MHVFSYRALDVFRSEAVGTWNPWSDIPVSDFTNNALSSQPRLLPCFSEEKHVVENTLDRRVSKKVFFFSFLFYDRCDSGKLERKGNRKEGRRRESSKVFQSPRRKCRKNSESGPWKLFFFYLARQEPLRFYNLAPPFIPLYDAGSRSPLCTSVKNKVGKAADW